MNKELGDFTIFGFTKKPAQLFQRILFERLAIIPTFIDFGDAGRLFFHTSYAQVAESETDVLLKLGFVRSHNYGPLSARQIIEHKLMGLDFVEENELHGNALIMCISKVQPGFSIYKSLIAIPQLYYSASKEEIICSDRMKAIVGIMDDVELDEDILPMHFLFRTVIGTSTYFRHIERMLPGQFVIWKNGEMHLHLIQDMQFADEGSLRQINADTLDLLYKSLGDVITDYALQVTHNAHNIGNLLSGGVDSSLIQHILSEHSHETGAQSFSFAPEASSFSFEVDYAGKASEYFHTDHKFVRFTQSDYPDLLRETIEGLASPPLLPSEPGIYSVARFVKNTNILTRFFISGQGADSLFGLPAAKKIKLAQNLSRIPCAPRLIMNMGKLLLPLHASGKIILMRGEKLTRINDPRSSLSPMNTIAIYADLDQVIGCFGERQVHAALEYRRNLAEQYKKSQHGLEKVFLIDLITDSYEVASKRHEMFLSNTRETLHPFFDDDVLRTGFRFHPDIRYIYRFKEKYLLKALLNQKSGLSTTWKPKGAAQFFEDFYEWMRVGSLKPLVNAIELPGFINRKDFGKLTVHPDIFLWSLLTLDLFQKKVVNRHRNRIYESVGTW